MNPKNRSAEETLLHSTPILKKILEHAEPWGNNPQNLTKAHPNFMEIEKAKKFEENISSYSERHIQMFYCTPPCKNAYKYAVSFVLQFFDAFKICFKESFTPAKIWRCDDSRAGQYYASNVYTGTWGDRKDPVQTEKWDGCSNCWKTFTTLHPEYKN